MAVPEALTISMLSPCPSWTNSQSTPAPITTSARIRSASSTASSTVLGHHYPREALTPLSSLSGSKDAHSPWPSSLAAFVREPSCHRTAPHARFQPSSRRGKRAHQNSVGLHEPRGPTVVACMRRSHLFLRGLVYGQCKSTHLTLRILSFRRTSYLQIGEKQESRRADSNR